MNDFRLLRRHAWRVATLACLCAATLLPHGAWAQSDKTLTLIVPLTTGSTVDTLARTLSPALGRVMGQAVVVENLVGAGGVSGTARLVRAPKDGQTLGLVSSNHVINPAIYKSMPFDSIKDITPISVLATVPLVLVVTNSLPVSNLKDLMAYAKAHPGRVDYGSAGNGSVLHLAGELLKSEGGLFLTHIPYRGTGPLTTDLIGGQIQMAFLSVTAAAPHIKAGKLKAIGVSTAQRSQVLPLVPTLAESGLPHYSFDAWIALIGPAGLPRDQVAKLYQDTRQVLGTKEMQDMLLVQGMTPVAMPPEATAAFFKAELVKHGDLVKKSGASND